MNTAHSQKNTGDTITFNDCVRLVRDRMHLDISKKKVQDAYALGKSTVILE